MHFQIPQGPPEVRRRPGEIIGKGLPLRQTIGKAIWHLRRAQEILESMESLDSKWSDFRDCMEKYLR